MALFRLFLLLVLVGSAAHAQPAISPSVDYHLGIADPKSESFRVDAVLRNITSDTLLFNFPIWAPGAYDLVYFGRFVSDLKASDAKGKSLKVIRRDSSTYAIVGVKGETRVSYRVHDIETLPNSLWFCLSDIEPDMAYAVGSALFGYPSGYKDVPYTLGVDLPKGWNLAMPLDTLPEGRGRFAARNYDELVDAPLQAGRMQRLDFVAGGRPHQIAVWSPKRLSDSAAARLVESTRRVVEIYSGFFGEMPYERYIYQIYLTDPSDQRGIRNFSFGALEHAASSSYLMPWFKGSDPVGSLAPVIAHEYWHLWSPKRFHVAELGPFDYQRAPVTSSLWFAEGLTEYYARLLPLRDGKTRIGRFLFNMERDIAEFYGKSQSGSIAELSRGIANVGFENIHELYSKGPVLGMLLDATIRLQSNNRKSLDDAMRHFNEEYGRTGRTFGDADIIPIMEKVTGHRSPRSTAAISMDTTSCRSMRYFRASAFATATGPIRSWRSGSISSRMKRESGSSTLPLAARPIRWAFVPEISSSNTDGSVVRSC